METNELRILSEKIKKVDSSWTSYSAYLMRKKMKDALSLIEKWYADGNKPNDLVDILFEYDQKGIIINRINYGYTYYMDELKKLKKNPYSLWEFYDRCEDKNALFKPPFVRYTANVKQNTDMFLNDVFYCGMSAIDIVSMNPTLIGLFSEDQRKMLAQELVKLISGSVVRKYTEDTRSGLVDALQNTMNMLNELGVLDNMKETHNSNAKRLGLKSFEVSDKTPVVEDGKILGVEFGECSVFQLEAMLSHYSNRLEKVREDIGRGLFALKFFDNPEMPLDIKPDLLNDEDLKRCQVRYVFWSHVYEDMLSGLHEMLLKNQDTETEFSNAEEVYELFVKKYETAFAELYGGLKEEGKIEEKTLENFRNEYLIFRLTNSSYRHVNYLTKSRLIEDLILQAEHENVNWGIMEDGEAGYKLKKHMLIGIDVPGLNMPLRLHYSLEELRTLMHDYLKTDEVPLYVGGDDFDIVGEHTGTQFITPITPEQKRDTKMLSKMELKDGETKVITLGDANGSFKGKGGKAVAEAEKKEVKITADTLRRAKHIACMQLPNMTEKLLTLKTKKAQKSPDYLNIFTGKIRRTPRRDVPKADANPSGR